MFSESAICKKLIIRHPHVFSDVTVNSTEEVLSNWDDIKRQTKSQETQSVAMAAIPKTFPALMKAQKVQKKAKKAGFDWPDAEGAFNKVLEETEELKEVVPSALASLASLDVVLSCSSWKGL